MKRGYAEYGPLARRQGHRQLLRTARLNVVGWLALVGLCAMVGVVAALLGNAVGWPWPVTGAAGAILVLAGVVALDRRRWGSSWTSYSWTDDPAEVGEVVDLLAQRGVTAEMVIFEGEPRLVFRNRDVRRVSAVVERRPHS